MGGDWCPSVVVQEPKALVRQREYVLKFGRLHLMSVEMAGHVDAEIKAAHSVT